MPRDDLAGKKVLFIATDGFEDTELLFPKIVLQSYGADVTLTGKALDRTLKVAIKGKVGYVVDLDIEMKDVNVDDFDALVIPGGSSPDRLRTMDEAVTITSDFMAARKPVASICHGPQLLIEADAVRGRKLTSWRAVKTDIINAGGEWVDKELVIDGNLITSRFPPDLPVWSDAIVEALK